MLPVYEFDNDLLFVMMQCLLKNLWPHWSSVNLCTQLRSFARGVYVFPSTVPAKSQEMPFLAAEAIFSMGGVGKIVRKWLIK